MNSEFPPLRFVAPQYVERRKEKGRRIPLPDELIARRSEIARVLGVKVQHLSQALKQMPDDERRAVFYKLTHEKPINLTGTGLKPIAEGTEGVTLAVPREDNLDKFQQKIEQFGTGELRKGFPDNPYIAHITTIEPGEPKDRLSDELFEQYDQLIGKDFVICEIEIISFQQGPRQQRNEIASVVQALERAFANGVHGTLFEHEESGGSCRAVIRCTGKMFRQLVEDRQWQRKISWFEPKPRFETFQSVWNDFRVEDLGRIESPPDDAPVVCVVDSGVTVGNPFLEPVARENMIRSFLRSDPDNPYDEFGHGSGVASLAAYHGLNLAKGAENWAEVWIASARILNDQNELEDERLFSTLLREVVETFRPLGVRIFNLAIGDVAKTWNPTTKRTAPRKSWVARTIDRLSQEYDVVFVTCTGNIDQSTIREFLDDGKPYPGYLCDETARILDPGQAALALTVGSVAAGTLTVSSAATAIALANQPSPFTRAGPGMEREVKPELVEVGGNLVYDRQGNWVRGNPGSSVVMASNKLTPAAMYDHGTSFAVPRVAHKLALVLKDLEDEGVNPVSAPLLKAFLVNSAAYRGGEDLGTVQDELDSRKRKSWLNVLGYGMPDRIGATSCDDYSAILFYQGMIAADQVAYFDVPIPAELADSSGDKRLTVTVAHYPEVQRWGLERYLGTDLKWRMFRGDVDREEIITAMSRDEETDETDEEVELPNELKFEHKRTLRSRGTVQHDVLEWTQHREEFSKQPYTLAIAAYKRWQRKVDDVPYAVVVRVEDLGHTANVYAEIEEILARLEVQARTTMP
ncbi:MAG: S8 family peptidase [Candidatus Nealsonbacteria bacterium]|nr:S8 family peptidase [Candidatus Nealsonbacteria bacterium]